MSDFALAWRLLLIAFFSSLSACAPGTAADTHSMRAHDAQALGGASVTLGEDAAVFLADVGQGVKFAGVAVGNKLAIHYGSVSVGTITVAVNDRPAVKLNVHSSGDAARSFLYAKTELSIPAGATLTVSRAEKDVPVAIDGIVVGDDELGLPPDIWNLPALPVEQGPYTADWKAISRLYTAPQWWRDAKFGAWSHWDPQSMPEQADWYSRGMYQEGSRQYTYHVQHFGPPSEYGYKDIAHNWVIDRWDPQALMGLYVDMGAKYFMAMGVHHDNFDCWDSAYQPWNSVRVGPKVDIVGTWEKRIARDASMACRLLASAFTIRRHGPGASSCPCATPATGMVPTKACLMMRCRRFSMEKKNGGREWIRRISMGRSTTRRTRCARRSRISLCGAWTTRSPNTTPM